MAKERAVQAGAMPVLVAVLKKHIKVPEVVERGSGALIVVCYTEELQRQALAVARGGAEFNPRDGIIFLVR